MEQFIRALELDQTLNSHGLAYIFFHSTFARTPVLPLRFRATESLHFQCADPLVVFNYDVRLWRERGTLYRHRHGHTAEGERLGVKFTRNYCNIDFLVSFLSTRSFQFVWMLFLHAIKVYWITRMRPSWSQFSNQTPCLPRSGYWGLVELNIVTCEQCFPWIGSIDGKVIVFFRW